MGVINRGDIFAGDSSDVWEIGFPVSPEGVRPVELAELDSNFSCRLAVKGSTPAIDRAVSAKNEANTRFLAFLTTAETTAARHWQGKLS